MAVALAMIASLAGVASAIVLGPRDVQPARVVPPASPPSADAVVLEGERLAYWNRFALNGLLVPLLDVDRADRWAAPSAANPCLETSRVTIDDQPLRSGAALPAGPFTLRWALADCRPFGPESLALWGIVEARLTHDDGQVAGRLQPRALIVVDGDGRPRRTEAAFEARLALVPLLRAE